MSTLFDNKYEKLEKLGIGGCGTVWKARNVVDNYYCALKILKDPVVGEDDKAYQALKNEFQLIRRAGSFGHPGIPQLYNIGIFNQEAYIEMTYYKGDSILKILQKETILPFDEIVSMFKDILGTMAFLHVDIFKDLMNSEDDHLLVNMENGGKIVLQEEDAGRLIGEYGIVHNDIHSKQFVRNHYTGKYVLLDFGLSIQGQKPVRKSIVHAGVDGYIAPEKVHGERPDFRTDVFAIGALMYECLTGAVPYPSNSFELKVPSISEKRKAAFALKYDGKELTPDYVCPSWLEEIVHKCLSLEPADRYPNAKALALDFETQLDVYLSRKKDGLSQRDLDVMERQRQLLDAQERRIASQQEIISDDVRQIAQLRETLENTGAERDASLEKVGMLGRESVALRRSRNAGWTASFILSGALAFILAAGVSVRPRPMPTDGGTAVRQSIRVASLTDSLSRALAEGRTMKRALRRAEEQRASLEREAGELRDQLDAREVVYDTELAQLGNTLDETRRDLENARRRIAELEDGEEIPERDVTVGRAASAPARSVVVRGSNNGAVTVNGSGVVVTVSRMSGQEQEKSRKTIDSLTAVVGRYKAELEEMAARL